MKSSSSKAQSLSAEQVQSVVERSGLSRQEFAAHVGCGTSQLFKYEKEGLPPRMDRSVRAGILAEAVKYGVVPENASVRAEIQKLSKGQRT